MFDLIPQPADLHRELGDFFEILADRIRTASEPLDANGEVPLASHATYSLGEIVAAYRFPDKKGALHLPQTGVLWHDATKTELLFVTLEKSGKDQSPTTRCADCLISPTLFHWESQNSPSAKTRIGRRLIQQRRQVTNVILLVRERKRDSRGQSVPCLSLGRALYRSHESERPMTILWELERPRPGWPCQAGNLAAG